MRSQQIVKAFFDSHPVLIRLAALVTGLAYAAPAMAQPVPVSPATMPRIATVDERYQSYNVEMAEVIGGTFWKPYGEQDKQQTAKGAPPDGAGLQAGRDATA